MAISKRSESLSEQLQRRIEEAVADRSSADRTVATVAELSGALESGSQQTIVDLWVQVESYHRYESKDPSTQNNLREMIDANGAWRQARSMMRASHGARLSDSELLARLIDDLASLRRQDEDLQEWLNESPELSAFISDVALDRAYAMTIAEAIRAIELSINPSEDRRTQKPASSALPIRDRKAQGRATNSDANSIPGDQSDALRAVVGNGLAGILSLASRIRSSDRVSQSIIEAVRNNAELLSRTSDEWAYSLKVSNKTVIRSDGWKEVMRLREMNKLKSVRPRDFQ